MREFIYKIFLKMLILIKKFIDSLRYQGLLTAIAKAIRYPFLPVLRRRAAKKWEKTLKLDSVKDRFQAIYDNNLWGNAESVSGSGSTLQYTENIRKELPNVFKNFSINSVFDAPCGDFNWMRYLLSTVDVDYIGGDIVASLVDVNNLKYKNEKISFICIDLIKGDFPQVDLMICRDCLFHLSYDDTRLVLNNFMKSGISYLITTTYKNVNYFLNKDIKTGEFRLIDLFSSPYNFPLNPLAVIDDWISPEPERQLCLWSREQVSLALLQFE